MIYRGGYNDWLEIDLDVVKSPGISTFNIHFRHTDPPQELDFQSAADYTARLIANRYDNLFLGMSGGLDSEFMAEVFYRNQISFTPIIGKTLTNNDHYYALDWCRKHNINPITFDFSKVQYDFFEAGKNFIKQNHIFGDGINLVLYLNSIAKKNNGNLLVGEPEIGQLTSEYDQPITDVFDVYFWQFGMELNGQTPGSFFSYTPEILLAQARELNVELNESSAKADLYQIPYRPKMDINDYRVTVNKIKNAFGHFFKLDQYSMPEKYIWKRQNLIDLLLKKQ